MIGFVIGGTKCAVCIGEIENDEMKIVNKKTVPTNFSITPYEKGEHGLGLAPQNTHVAQWKALLEKWLKLNDIL